MHEDVKKYAENNDIKGLRYIFVDCLDVDPTFEKYAEDFDYCKKKAGLFEAHKELTPMTENQRMWNDDYWVQLKTDLLKNFSEERFRHMRQVAQVVYAEKIVRITEERKEQERRLEERRRQLEEENQHPLKEEQALKEQVEENHIEHIQMSKQEEQDRRLEERRRQLEEENQRLLDKERKQKERIEKIKADSAKTTASSMESFDSKKVLRVVLVVVIILVIILIIVGM